VLHYKPTLNSDSAHLVKRYSMKFMFPSVALLFMIFLTLPATLQAAEVANLKTAFSRTTLTIEYDLVGAGSEKESSVEVQLEIKGEKYSPAMLSISGDFGHSIALGTHRKIIWNHALDFPEGLDAVFKCSVNAVPASQTTGETLQPTEGFRSAYFAVNRQTVIETRTQLMWSRNANISIKPMRYPDAQKLIKKLNLERFAGYDDWRIPTRDDLEGLVYFGKKAGWGHELAHFIADYLSTCGFDNVQLGNYWTSTPVDASMNKLSVTNTWNGISRTLDNSNYYYLWPVRSLRQPHLIPMDVIPAPAGTDLQ